MLPDPRRCIVITARPAHSQRILKPNHETGWISVAVVRMGHRRRSSHTLARAPGPSLYLCGFRSRDPGARAGIPWTSSRGGEIEGMDFSAQLLAFGLCLIFLILVPFTVAGLALINAGLGRSRSAAHAMTTALCVMGTAMLTYFVFGSAVQGGNEPPLWHGWSSTLPSRSFFFRGISWGQPA